jgi:hypothetical protein
MVDEVCVEGRSKRSWTRVQSQSIVDSCIIDQCIDTRPTPLDLFDRRRALFIVRSLDLSFPAAPW